MKKVSLVGSAQVGKSTYVHRIECPEEPIHGKYVPTIGVDVSQVSVDGIQIMIWDLAGQERYGGLRDAYLISADVVFVVAKDMDEYEKVRKRWWKDHLRHLDPIPIKPLILNPDHVNLEDRESCLKPLREILA